MNRSSLAVATAIFAVIVALALPISKFFRPEGHSLHAVLTSHWVLTHFIGAIGYAAFVFLVLGLAVLFAKEFGGLGIAAAVVGALGAMLCLGDQYYAFFMQSVYAQEYPGTWGIFDGDSPLFDGVNGLVLPVRDLMFVFGGGALAVALAVYAPVARWASAAFGIGLFIAVYGVTISYGVGKVGTIIESIGLLGMAWSLLQQRWSYDGEVTGGSSWLDDAPAVEQPGFATPGSE